MWLQSSSRLKSHNFFIFENQFGALLDYVLFWNYEKMCRNFPFLWLGDNVLSMIWRHYITTTNEILFLSLQFNFCPYERYFTSCWYISDNGAKFWIYFNCHSLSAENYKKIFFRWESGPPSWAFLSSQAESGQQRLAGLARLARLPRFPRPGKKETANVKIILDSHRNCSNLSFISVFSVFQIVKFKNEACTTNTGEMGTCYTESECQSAGGTPAGSCASSFGSCCLCKS